MQPDLTFFCELEPAPLQNLFSSPALLEIVQQLQATVSLGIMDFSAERCEVVQLLNKANIPVTAWLLLPKEQGYWFNLDNHSAANARYLEFRRWTEQNNLKWKAVGLDIEPDLRQLEQLPRNPAAGLRTMLMNALNGQRQRVGQMAYQALIAQMRSDGFFVESYQFPVICDERKAGSTFLQRMTGVIDLPVEREVLMLYTSFIRGYGPGLLWSYAGEARAVGIGSTGGGVELAEVVDTRPLAWDEFQRDLLIASKFCRNIYIFSLEGCFRQEFLTPLMEFDWNAPVVEPVRLGLRVNSYRKIGQMALWSTAHPWFILSSAMVLYFLVKQLKKKPKK